MFVTQIFLKLVILLNIFHYLNTKIIIRKDDRNSYNIDR